MKKFHFISKQKTWKESCVQAVKETDGTFWQVIVDTVCTILFPKSKVMIKNNLQSLLKIIKIVINLYNLSVYKISHNRVSKLDSKNKLIKLHILKSKTKPQKLNKSQKKISQHCCGWKMENQKHAENMMRIYIYIQSTWISEWIQVCININLW